MHLVSLIANALSKTTRAAVWENLAPVVGATASPAQRRRLVRSSFVSYGRYWSDLAQLPNLVGTNFDRYFDDKELIQFSEAIKGRAVIIALPHIGSWEIAGLWAHEHGFAVSTVAERASSPELTKWFNSERSRLGISVYTYGESTTIHLLEALERGELVALVADRNIDGEGVEVDFFGRRARMPAGPALLALRSGAPLVPFAVYQQAGDRHVPVLLPPVSLRREGRLRDDVARVTQDLASAFEVLIRRAPEQWHVFQPIWSDARDEVGGT